MAVEVFGSPKMDYSKSSEQLICLFSHHKQQSQFSDYLPVSKVGKVIPLSNRTGHARFRRGPIKSNSSSSSSTSSAFFSDTDQAHDLFLAPASLGSPSPVSPMDAVPQPPPSAPAGFVQRVQPQTMNIDFEKRNIWSSNGRKNTDLEQTKNSFSFSSSSSFLSSDITGDGSVSNGKLGSSIVLTPKPASSGGKPPLSSVPYKKRCRDHSDDLSNKGPGSTSGSGNCHCSKRRKNCTKEILRVPAISSKVADIPADDYSWRKYGQKPINGSPYPRGYYKCSTLRGCPAKKHVERDPNDPTMLIVTYEGEHRHIVSAMQENEVGGSKSNQMKKY